MREEKRRERERDGAHHFDALYEKCTHYSVHGRESRNFTEAGHSKQVPLRRKGNEIHTTNTPTFKMVDIPDATMLRAAKKK